VVIHQDTPLKVNLNINNENQYCEIGTVYVWRILAGGKEIKVMYIIGGPI
jgi:hypothetical protein